MGLERTFSIIKPDATRRNLTGKINAKFEDAGLRVVAQKRIHMTKAQAGKFYEVHSERPFYDELCEFMSSEPVIVQVLEGENAISKNREVMGATNPADAAPGTIRAEFAESVGENSVHGSDSIENAKIDKETIDYIILAHNFGDVKSTTTSGISYETLDWNYSSIMASGMVVTQTNIDQSASTSTLQSRRFQQDRGVFVQEELQVGDAVYVAASMRGDKSSTLGKTDEFNWYPKVAGSYQFGSMAGVFDNLKVRLAFGQTGNLPPPTAKYTSMSPYNIGGMGGLVSGCLLYTSPSPRDS